MEKNRKRMGDFSVKNRGRKEAEKPCLDIHVIRKIQKPFDFKTYSSFTGLTCRIQTSEAPGREEWRPEKP